MKMMEFLSKVVSKGKMFYALKIERPFCLNFFNSLATGTPVVIGNECWICNSATIMGGTYLPDKMIVASHSMVNKNMTDISTRSMIAGIPARLVKSGIVKIDDFSVLQEIDKYFNKHLDSTECFFTRNLY